MPKIKVVNDNIIYHPIESCIPDLVELLKDIYERQKVMYRVPYDEVNNINVDLDSSPDDEITVFNEKYAFVQSQSNRIISIIIDLRQELKIWKSLRARLSIFYKKARNFLLVKRPEIKTLRNKELQEAALQNELYDLTDVVNGVDSIIEELEDDLDILKLKKENLDSVNINLSRQQKVVEDMMALNGIVGVRGVRVKLNVNK